MTNATEIAAEAFCDSLKHQTETQKLHALIKQLGEALALVINEKYCGVEPATTANGCYTDSNDEISARLAILAYNNYLRERGE